MLSQKVERLRSIKSFPSLVKYLRDELDWPIESDNFDDLTFDYEPEELGIDAKTAVKIKDIKQLRPLVSKQPWGIFFINFEPKQLPIVVLRRILRSLVIKKRGDADKAHQAAWKLHDLLFISSYGESEYREITFAHFSEPNNRLFGDLPTLRVLGWDDDDTKLKIDHVVHTLSEKMRWPEDEDDAETWRRKWSDAFELRPREVITTSKDLAIRLADLAKSIRQRANLILGIESEKGALRKLHKAFQTALIHDLNEDDFADMYAQTIAYGLLAARVSRPAGVVADNLADMVPITNPFLKEMLGTFLSVGGRKGKIDFDELGIQEVVDLLNSRDTHMEAILRDFGKRTMQEDPVIHFYELFLKEYDKKKKVERGVFYTPQPVVSYIIRSVHELLQKEFGLEDGLASTITWGEMAKRNPNIKIPEGVLPDEHFVQMLDPATGTATFLVEIIEVIYQTMLSKWRKEKYTEFELGDLWNEYVPKHLLPRLYGFELMMAPYAIAHMKIGLKLYETGYKFRSDERAHIYLTNSLEPPSDMAEQPEFEEWSPALAHEAKAVNAVKRGKRFTVVVGNPPYSGHSWNLTPTLRRMVEPYHFLGKEKIKEKGALQLEKSIQDDYIKFFRYGENHIEYAGTGILGFVTSHGFLDNPFLRGMRYAMLTTFTRLFVIDLHGNVLRHEKSPDGSPDNNVFDIKRTGVAVSLFRKLSASNNTEVRHADLWGDRDTTKYPWLNKSTIQVSDSQPVESRPSFYLFIPQDSKCVEEYEQFFSIAEIMPVYSKGVVTGRDAFVIDFETEALLERMRIFTESNESIDDLVERFDLNPTDWWNVDKARQEMSRVRDFSKHIRPVLYRPFDKRSCFYHPAVFMSPRRPVMKNIDPGLNNLLLITSRMTKGESFQHITVANGLAEAILLSSKTSNNAIVFPLYLYPDDTALNFALTRQPNFTKAFFEAVHKKTGLVVTDGSGDLQHSIGTDEILYYIMAILHSATYRLRYAELLTRDFPRLPLTSSLELFKELAKLGRELVALHLMESPTLDKHITKFIGERILSLKKLPSPLFAKEGNTPSSLPDREGNTPLTPLDRGEQLSPPLEKGDAGGFSVEKVFYSDNTVWIDKAQTQGFHGVPENVWNFHIGGYQVCQKWLKDRKGRTLSAEDINHYHRIVVALNETIRIMAEIDKVIEQHGGWPGAFQDKKEYTVQQEPLQKVAEEKEEYNADVETGLKPVSTGFRVKPGMTTRNKDDYKTWLALSQWAKETLSINTFWINFALDISNKLKNGTKLSEKEKTDMKKCWGQAAKKGFSAR